MTEMTAMDSVLLWIGRIGGLLGVLVAAVAVAVRASGSYSLGGFQVGTLLVAGIAAMVFGCLCFLAVLTSHRAAVR
jgi:hypothetical protein